MKMHNPPHPGEVIRELCLEPLNLTVTDATQSLGVSPKALSRGGFCCRNLVQRGQETFATAAFGHLLQTGPAGNLFGQGRRHDPLRGNLLPRSQIDNLAVDCVGNCHIESHGASPIIARNSRGEITRTPKRSAPTKSLVLNVTRKSARLSTPNSRTKSSFGSGRRGRQRKKMRRKFALAQRKRNTSSMSLPLRDPPVQTRLSVCSYSRTRGTERLIRHRWSPSSRNRRWDAPTLDISAATSTLVSITTRYMARHLP